MEPKSVASNVDARIRAISNDLDLLEAPPIHQKRLVTFFNHFILTMVDFLNNFSNSCSYRLFTFERKIGKIEAELRLLEIKLNSIPGLEAEEPKKRIETPTTDVAAAEELPESQEESTAETVASSEAEEAPRPQEVDPVLAKYIKMTQVGVPVAAVKMKMKSEGVDPELLKM